MAKGRNLPWFNKVVLIFNSLNSQIMQIFLIRSWFSRQRIQLLVAQVSSFPELANSRRLKAIRFNQGIRNRRAGPALHKLIILFAFYRNPKTKDRFTPTGGVGLRARQDEGRPETTPIRGGRESDAPPASCRFLVIKGVPGTRVAAARRPINSLPAVAQEPLTLPRLRKARWHRRLACAWPWGCPPV